MTVSLAHALPSMPIQKDRQLRVVLFSGGSGTKSITEHLANHSQVQLTILINCYDDGHSTGRLRRFIPGMLGPSDVRKNIARLMPSTDRASQALKTLSDFRLPVGVSVSEATAVLQAIVGERNSGIDPGLRKIWEQLSVRQARGLGQFTDSFLSYLNGPESRDLPWDFTDCALGNIFFAGCYLSCGRNFNRAVEAFSRFYEVRADVLNITRGENHFLVAEKHDGNFILSEAELVSSPAKIRRICLIDEWSYRERIETASPVAEETRRLISAAERIPEVNPKAAEALRSADVIIYGPGTQHSSLLPSYFTRGVGSLVVGNRSADKIFVANSRRDVDIQTDDVNDLADKFLEAMNRGSRVKGQWRDYVTHLFVQRPDESNTSSVPFDRSTFRYPLDTVRVRDWEVSEGQHHGGYVVEEIKQIVQSRIEIELAPRPYLVSVIVPVLNEAATIEPVLKQLVGMDFSCFGGMGKEVIVVDGGSTDGTGEIARRQRGVKVISSRLPGRGAALRQGIEECRGNLVLFFPSDNEYQAEDLHQVVAHLSDGTYKAVFGTRMTKVMDLSRHLRRIYGGHRIQYLLSKYGGMMISIATLLLYNRYVTDTLTGVKGFDGRTLRNLNLASDGLELEAEIVAKLCRSKQYILEVPIDFKPRTRDQGKKTSVWDGFRILTTLLRYRFES